MISWIRRLESGAITLTMLLTVALPAVAAEPLIYPSDKGGFQYSEPPPVPAVRLDLAPIAAQVAAAASERCGSPLAAAPLDLGDAESFLGNLVGNAASAAVGQLVGGLLGTRSGGDRKPKLEKDPIRNRYKQKIQAADGRARLRIGGRLEQDRLLLSARIDKAKSKGTFHTVFLERPDCTRIWPEQYVPYGLWGSFKLSVSVTETRSTYRNGELVDRSVDRSAWSRAGIFNLDRGFSLWDQLPGEAQRLVLNADEAYSTQLRNEIGPPAWQELGYAKPVQGLRAIGAMFRVGPSELTPGTIAVVHITDVDTGRYRTLGFPLTFSLDAKGRLTFARLDD